MRIANYQKLTAKDQKLKGYRLFMKNFQGYIHVE